MAKEGKRRYRVGIIGYGFIGRVHAYGHLNLPLFYRPLPFETKITHVCTRREETARAGREELGADHGVTDFREITENPDVDIVHICSPNSAHYEQLLSAMAHGKAIYCDKPLVASAEEAEGIRKALQTYTGCFGMTLQNRFFPATMRARQLVEEGFVGRVLAFRGAYLHSGSTNPKTPLKWKLSAEAGGGVIADLGAHILDLMNHLVGDFSRLSAATLTAYPTRPDPADPGKAVPVDAEDHMAVLARTGPEDTPGVGVIEASKVATGTEDELRFEIHGTKGGLRFNCMRPSVLEVYRQDASDEPMGGFRGWQAVDAGQRYPKPAANFPGPKFSIGWIRSHMACLAAFLFALHQGRTPQPDVRQGLYIQDLIEAVRQSAMEGGWVDAPERG
jgi:predicted dehydrogenase